MVLTIFGVDGGQPDGIPAFADLTINVSEWEQKYAAHSALLYVRGGDVGCASDRATQPATMGESTVNTAEFPTAQTPPHWPASSGQREMPQFSMDGAVWNRSSMRNSRVGCGIGANTTGEKPVVSEPKSPSPQNGTNAEVEIDSARMPNPRTHVRFGRRPWLVKTRTTHLIPPPMTIPETRTIRGSPSLTALAGNSHVIKRFSVPAMSPCPDVHLPCRGSRCPAARRALSPSPPPAPLRRDLNRTRGA